MKKLFRFCCLSLLLALLPASHVQAQGSAAGSEAQNPTAFQQALDRIDKAAGIAGVLVVSLSSGEVVCRSRPADALVPASLMKLLTSYAALKKLGPSFTFTTKALAAGQPVDGVISGDIWIKGSGDPFFVSEKVSRLAQAIKDSGVRQIEGGIFVDNGFFQPPSERICLDNDCAGAYNPVVSAAAIDFNTLTVRITVPAKAGKTFSAAFVARLFLSPRFCWKTKLPFYPCRRHRLMLAARGRQRPIRYLWLGSMTTIIRCRCALLITP